MEENQIEQRGAAEEKIERRVYEVLDAETRAAGEDGKRTLVGHAAVFNKDSVEMYGFRERVASGAFSKTIKADDIRALWNHDPSSVLGRKKSKTLRLNEDSIGLAFEVDLPNTQLARDAAELIDRGDVSQCSFGFRTVTDEWRMQDGKALRTLIEVKLFDVSPVTFPAYPDTDVSLRSADFDAALRSLEAWQKGQATGRPIEALRRELDLEELDNGIATV